MLLLSFCMNEYKALKQQNLVVYNTGKSSYIELIDGKYYTTLFSNTNIIVYKNEFAIKAMHTNIMAWRQRENKTNPETRVIDGKIALILNQSISTHAGKKFPVDYLIINYTPDELDIESLAEIFTPKQIIISNNFSHNEQENLAKKARNMGYRLHTTAIDGAFVLNAF